MTLLDKLFGRKPRDISAQKEMLKSANTKERMNLAKDSKTRKEILYYLAEKDPDPKIRKAVIQNKSMPVQASAVLAADSDVDVRLALAARLVDLLPDLSQEKHSQLYAFAVQALGTLALDEVLKIRLALSSTLKDHSHTPPKIAGKLARDIEREVSEPILRFCAALSDQDLLDILKAHPASWVIQAVAGRESVSADVSVAVIETEDPPGGRILIENDGANITESLLRTIVEKAKSFPEWQKPTASRKSLPMSIAKDLAEFVDASVRDILAEREDFNRQDTEEIASIFRRRLDFATEEELAPEDTKLRLEQLISEGGLTEEKISDALAMRERDFVYGGIAYKAGTSPAEVQKIFDMKTPKAIVALCWKAELSMRLAFQLQKELAHIQPKDLIYPRDGTDYPMSEDEINWQLEFLGLKAA